MFNFQFDRPTQTTTAPMYPHQPIGTTLPTGMPAGTYMSPITAPVGQPAAPAPGIEPQTVQDTAYLPGYLRTQIGKLVRLQMLIGTTGPLVDRIGTLLKVGANYVIIKPQNSDNLLTADLYSIKFVEIYF